MFQRLKISQLWISASVLKLQVQVAHFIPIKLFLSSDNSKNLVYPSFYVPISKLIPELLQLCPPHTTQPQWSLEPSPKAWLGASATVSWPGKAMLQDSITLYLAVCNWLDYVSISQCWSGRVAGGCSCTLLALSPLCLALVRCPARLAAGVPGPVHWS